MSLYRLADCNIVGTIATIATILIELPLMTKMLLKTSEK